MEVAGNTDSHDMEEEDQEGVGDCMEEVVGEGVEEVVDMREVAEADCMH